MMFERTVNKIQHPSELLIFSVICYKHSNPTTNLCSVGQVVDLSEEVLLNSEEEGKKPYETSRGSRSKISERDF